MVADDRSLKAGVGIIFGAKKYSVLTDGLSPDEDHYEVILKKDLIALYKVSQGIKIKLAEAAASPYIGTQNSVSLILSQNNIAVKLNNTQLINQNVNGYTPLKSYGGIYIPNANVLLK